MDPRLWPLIEGEPEDEIAVLARLAGGVDTPPGMRVVARFKDIVSSRLAKGKLIDVRGDDRLVSVKAPLDLTPKDGAPRLARARSRRWRADARGFSGVGVCMGVVDWGFDFTHPNFLTDHGRTRLLALWDQRPRPNDRLMPYGYGRLFLPPEINHALEAEDPFAVLGYNHWGADPRDVGTHGTHVADIAAGLPRLGNGGVAPGASLIFVHLANHERGPRSLGNSVTLIEAVDFILKVARGRPCVINLSLGGLAGPHDGTSLLELGLDAALETHANLVIVQSGGNYFQRRIHTEGRIATGESRQIEWTINPYDQTRNQLDFWYPGKDRLVLTLVAPDGEAVAVAPPDTHGGVTWRGVELGRFGHRLHDPNNDDNQVAIILDGRAKGAWRIIIEAQAVSDGRYNAWIERDDGAPGSQSTLGGSTSRGTTNSICSGRWPIVVGAYDSANRRRAAFSSCGPTRDGRLKPDILAPGCGIVAAQSLLRDEDEHGLIAKSGSSMAAPQVAGTIALMMQAAGGRLGSREVRQALLETADSLADDAGPCAGSGLLSIERALARTAELAAAPAAPAGLTSAVAPASASPSTSPPITVATGGSVRMDGVATLAAELVGGGGPEDVPTQTLTLLPDPPETQPVVGPLGLKLVLTSPFRQGANANNESLSILAAGLMREKYDAGIAADIIARKVPMYVGDVAPGSLLTAILVTEKVGNGEPPVELLASLAKEEQLSVYFDASILRAVEHAWAVHYAWTKPPAESAPRPGDWFDRALFASHCWQQFDRVEALRAAVRPMSDPATVERRIAELWHTLQPGLDLLRLYEGEVAAQGRREPPESYQLLLGPGNEDPGLPAQARARFLAVCSGRFRDLAWRALSSWQLSKPNPDFDELLKRFIEDLKIGRNLAQGTQTANQFLGKVADANAPPFMARIKTSFDTSGREADLLPNLAKGAFVQCQMLVDASDWTDLFGSHYYWEVLRIDRPAAAGPMALKKTDYARKRALVDAKAAQARRYAAEDWGPSPMLTAFDAMDVSGPSIKDLIGFATQKQSDREVVLKEVGEYRIRCRWYRDAPADKAALLRAPSVAYVDCNVVDPVVQAQATVLDVQFSPDLAKDVGQELDRALVRAQLALASKGLPDFFPKEAIPATQRQVDDLKERIKQRQEVLTEHARGAAAIRFAAVFVLDSGPSIPLVVEAFRRTDGTYLVFDSTVEKGRYGTGKGNAPDAIKAALQSLLEAGEYGRGYCSIIVWSPAGNVDWQRRTFRVTKGRRGVFAQMLEDLSMVLSVLAVAAAPFTAGASLALMIPAGMIGAIPAGMRIADRIDQHSFKALSMETALDIVDAASGYFGVVGKGVGTLRFVKFAKGFAIADRAAGYGGIVLGNLAFFDALHDIQKSNMLPAAKSQAIAMLFANKLLSEGLSVGARLMEHTTAHRATGHDDLMEQFTRAAKRPADVSEADFARGKALIQNSARDISHIGVPPHLHAHVEMMKLARELTGTTIRVVRDPALDGATAEVRYALDRFGFVSEVYIALGPGANKAQMRSHATIAAHIASYSTLFGRLKTLCLRAFAVATGDQTKSVGTGPWEAAIELWKLNMQLVDHVKLIGKGGRQDSPGWWDAYAAGLIDQMAEHEARLNASGPGTGVIAAADRGARVARLEAEAKAMLGNGPTDVRVVLNPSGQNKTTVRRTASGKYEIEVPQLSNMSAEERSHQMAQALKRYLHLSLLDTRTPAEEAEFRGLPEAETHLGYVWRWNGSELAYAGSPKRDYDAATGMFVDAALSTFVDMHGQITPKGREWLAKQKGSGRAGDDFERIIRHVHGGEAVAQRSPTYFVFLTKEVVPAKPARKGGAQGPPKTVKPTLRSIVTDLQKAGHVGAGGPNMSDAMLAMKVSDFIKTDPVLKPLADEIRASGNSKWIADLERLGDVTLGRKEPDLFEFDAKTNQGSVTDITLAVGDPVHNLKTLIDSMALEIATGSKVSAYDWRSASNSKPITAADIRAQLAKRASDIKQQLQREHERARQAGQDSKDLALKQRQEQRERERVEQQERDRKDKRKPPAGESIGVGETAFDEGWFEVTPAAIRFPHVLRDHLGEDGSTMVNGTVPLTPDRQRTGFYDVSQGATAKDPTLQARLEAILGKGRYRSVRRQIAVSVVDLTGARKFAPMYAAHNDAANFYAASTGKVTGLLAAYQLLADVRDFISRNSSITTKDDLVQAIGAEWMKAGIPQSDHPDIANVLVVEPGPPAGARLRARLIARFNDISHGNVNGSTAFVLLKFPYIGSTLLAHGLFRPATRNGLWSRQAFGAIMWIPWDSFKPRRMSIAPWGGRNPYPGTPSNSVTAASIAQFMTLAAQGRLVDRASSAAILRHLQFGRGGCVPGNPDLGQLESSGSIAVKCGIYGGVAHMPLHFKATDGSREFVITILTRNYVWDTAGNSLFEELLTLF